MDHDGYGYSGSSGNNPTSRVASRISHTAFRSWRARPVVQSFISSAPLRARSVPRHSPRRSLRLWTGSCSSPLPTRAPGAHAARTRQAGGVLSHAQSTYPRSRHDPLDLHPRQSRLKLRPGGRRRNGGGGAQVRGSGTNRHYLDMTANLPLVDPTKIVCPVA